MKRNDYLNSGLIDGKSELKIFEQLPELYLILSPAKEVLTASNAYLAAMDLSREAVKHLDLEDVFSLYNTSNPSLSSRMINVLDEVILSKECRTIDAQQVRHRYYEIIQSPVLNPQHEISYIIHKLLDVTRLIKKEIEFERRIEQDGKRLTDTFDLLSKVEEAGSTGSYQIALDSQRISFSDGMYRLLGFVPEGLEPSLDFIKSISDPGDHERISEILASAIARQTGYEYVRRVFHPNGEMHYILAKGKVITDKDGKGLYVLGVAHDITDQKIAGEALLKAHQELQESNAMLRSVFDATMIGMSLLQPVRNENHEIVDFIITLVSRGLENETGRSDLVGTYYTKEYPGVKDAGLFDLMLKVMATGEAEQLEYYYPFEGFNKWYACTFVRMNGCLVATNQDITPMREAEANVRAMQERQKTEIFKASIRTQEEERRRMAENLRNGIGQLLYAVKINLKHVDPGKAVNDPEGFQNAKQYTDKILAEAIREVRRLSQQMTPAILEDFGLEETILELCKQFRPDIDVTCQITGLQSRLDADVEVSIYRMVQELLVNVVNHAKASEAIIEIKQENGCMYILVQDNGIGFNQVEAGKNGLGLATLMNKVRLLNGRIKIKADAGTMVNIVLPLDQYMG